MTTAFGPFRIGHHTHEGPRETNQDTVLSVALSENRWLLAVADGMGGLEEGELASKTALEALFRSISDGASLADAVRDANAAVYEEAQGRPMGTTLVAAVVSGRQAEIVNVGDSRAYQSDPLGLIQVTRDHTMANEAEREGLPHVAGLAEDAGQWGNALARYLGEGPEVEVDRFGPLDFIEGGWILLCSDGLHGVFSADEMDEFLVGRKDAQEAAAELVAEALSRETGDNVSVALMHWPEASSEIHEGTSPLTESRRESRREGREKILIGPSKSRAKKTTMGMALKVFLIVIPLMILLVFLVNWIISL
jgi:protein phosphatase